MCDGVLVYSRPSLVVSSLVFLFVYLLDMFGFDPCLDCLFFGLPLIKDLLAFGALTVFPCIPDVTEGLRHTEIQRYVCSRLLPSHRAGEEPF